MEQKKWYIRLVMLIGPLVILSGCLEFKSIEQPSSVLPDEVFAVFIEATTILADSGWEPYIGIRLPNGWTVPGETIPFTGICYGTIVYDANLALEQESLSPSPQGYTWWVGTGSYEESEGDSEGGSAYAEVQIQTNHQAGRFAIDYMLGFKRPLDLSSQQRSDNHLIEVVDEVTPREPQAVAQGDTVALSWDVPLVSEGVIGYDVYRNGQMINTDLVLTTVYVDENPAQELVCYAISSLYDGGDVHIMPYEISVLVFSGGTGDPNDPYRITRAEQLVSFSSTDFPYLLDKCFILDNDIDLDQSLPGRQVFDRAVIAPDISELRDGFQGTAFTGIFDGNGFRISNLTMVGQGYLGLMGTLDEGGRVLNLGVMDANVVGTGGPIGILAGTNRGFVDNCYSTGSVSGEGDVGGLVGDNSGHISNCYSTALISGEGSLGGLVGYNECQIAFCYSTGSISGEGDVGGLVGQNRKGNICNCYSTGTVNGKENAGGLVGTNSKGFVINCLWDIKTSGRLTSAGGVGKTTAQMKMASTFVGWGCGPIWTLNEGLDYPRLFWEDVPGDVIANSSQCGNKGSGSAES